MPEAPPVPDPLVLLCPTGKEYSIRWPQIVAADWHIKTVTHAVWAKWALNASSGDYTVEEGGLSETNPGWYRPFNAALYSQNYGLYSPYHLPGTTNADGFTMNALRVGYAWDIMISLLNAVNFYIEANTFYAALPKEMRFGNWVDSAPTWMLDTQSNPFYLTAHEMGFKLFKSSIAYGGSPDETWTEIPGTETTITITINDLFYP